MYGVKSCGSSASTSYSQARPAVRARYEFRVVQHPGTSGQQILPTDHEGLAAAAASTAVPYEQQEFARDQLLIAEATIECPQCRMGFLDKADLHEHIRWVSLVEYYLLGFIAFSSMFRSESEVVW